MRRSILTNRITPPKYKVGKFVLNEIEVREMIAKIAEGTLDPKGIVLIDEDGKSFKFNHDGSTKHGGISRWNENSKRTKRKIIANRLNDKKSL